MSKQEEMFRRYEKLAKTAKKSVSDPSEKPASCARCMYCRPDFKYRKCQIGEWLKGLLVSGIMDQLSGLFDSVNTQVGDIAAQVGTTPALYGC